jgi:hypothetical protein
MSKTRTPVEAEPGAAPGVRRLVSAARAADRRALMAEALAKLPPLSEALLLTASRRSGLELVREVAAARGSTFGVHCLTLAQLAAEVAAGALAERGAAPLSALAAEAVAARSLAHCRAESPLAFFEPVAEAPGMLRALVATLGELRLHGARPRQLASLGPRGSDLARLLAAYEDELARWALLDAAALLGLAAEAAHRPHRYRGLPLLLLDVPLRAPAEANLVAALAAAAPEVLAALPAADLEGSALLAAALGGPGVEQVPAPPTGPGGDALPRLERVRRFVFLPEAPGEPLEEAADGSVAFFSTPGEGPETVEVARRILRLAEVGVPFDRVAILLRDPDAYQPLVEDALARAGIPAWTTRGALRPDPAGRAFLALLDCGIENLSARRFAEYLSLGQVPAADDAGAPPARPVPWVVPDEEERPGSPGRFAALEDGSLGPDTPRPGAAPGDEEEPAEPGVPVVAGTLRTPLHWEQLLVEAAVVGGAARWRRRLAGLEAELRLQLEGSDGEEVAYAHAERRLERLQHLERFALPLIDALEALPSSAPWGEWLPRLERLATLALRRPRRVLQTLAELRPMAEVGPLPLREVRQVLAQRLAFLRATPAERPYGRVFVGAVDEARGRAFHTVFLPGLAEGLFPRRVQEDPLLLDADRARLPLALPTQEVRVARERLLLRLAAGAAEHCLVASYPTLDTLQGRARVPSFYALDLLRAADGALPAQRELERRAKGTSRLLQGWPAPRIPEEAIDEAEHDLAALHPLLALPPEQTRGHGRFLLALNEHLGRSLRARGRRWRSGWYPADGLVEPSAAGAAHLATHRLAARPWSATALESWAACPYRFLLRGVHRLAPREEAAALERLDPLTRGQLFHQVQAVVQRDLRDTGLLPLRPDSLATALDRLDTRLAELAGQFADRLAPAIPRVWDAEVDALRTDLRGWLQAAADDDGAWVPRWFELAFGLPADDGRDPESRPEPVPLPLAGGLRLRGAIDLVETTADGTRLRVTDHKTGRPRDAQRLAVGGGEALQPLLYALVAERLLDLPAVGGRLYYCTQRGGYKVLAANLDPFARLDLEETLSAIDTAVAGGFLPAAPKAGACAWCDYRPVCGPREELRTARKRDDERLRGLREVRARE